MANALSKYFSDHFITPRVQEVLKSQALPPAYGSIPNQEVSLKDAIGQPHDADYALLYAVYKLNADVSGSVHKWAGGITSPGWRFSLMDETAEITPKLKKQMQEIDRWISHPNPNLTLSSILYETVIHLAITGGAFWYVSRDAKGNPLEIWPMHPAITRIIANVQGEILGYVMRSYNTQPVVFTPDEVIYFRLPNPTNSIYGEGRVELIVEEAGIDLQALRSNKAIFANGLSPSAVLMLDDQATQADAKLLTDQLNTSHRGTDKQHKLVAVSRVKDFKPWTMTLRDMEFLGLRGLATEKVTTAMGIPKVLLGNHNAGDYATTKFLVREMHQNVFVPVQQLLSQAITEKLIHSINDAIRFELNKPDSSDPDTARKDMIQAESVGILTTDEVRQEAFGLAPTDTDVDEKPTDKPTDSGKADATATTEADATPEKSTKSLKKSTATDTVTERENQKDQLAQAFEPSISTFFGAQEQRYLSKLSSGVFTLTKRRIPRPTDATGDDANPELDDFTQDSQADGLLESVFAAGLYPSLIAGSQAAQLQISITLRFDQINPFVQHYLQTDALTHVQAINETTRNLIRGTLTDGVNAGEGVPELSARIQQVFTSAKAGRANLIARNETAEAFEYANQAAAVATGLDLVRVFVTAEDERVCVVCGPLDGTTTPINVPFPNGEPGSCHIACRCTSVYEVAK